MTKQNMTEGRVEAIWIKRFKRGPMDAVEQAEMVANQGLVGNADQGGRRQITILDAAVWEQAIAELGVKIDPTARRANILVRGLDLANRRKQILQLGDCRIRIFNEAKPCERMDEVQLGLKAALYDNWRGGACGQVITGGRVQVGDVAQWQLETS
ncbi:MOSC domain containing protein [Halothece sp. PCC 7418]|uniref:MOSC domain-containing protein n=1 Tax=Halothece sp. (strain PCC 7418) TaxID=65093 RepID=UPI0002A07A90|nr:MOSC domain-containing protein [Halothece sp. PCC 7418]AFZ45074.1 MOSC domain containing protein [Halothece sp. PCC 7418]